MEERVTTPYGIFYCDPARDTKIYEQLTRYGAHQHSDLAMLLSFVRPHDIVIDIGAHIGTFTIPLAQKAQRVYAFEPLPENFKLLEKNVTENELANVTLYNLALSDRKQNLQADISEKNLGGTSLTAARRGTIQSLPLPENIDHIDIVKIDTEGMEIEILRGMRKRIEQDRPILFIEINKRQLSRHGHTISELECFLKEYNYSFFKNLHIRHSHSEQYIVGKLWAVRQGGVFYDLLAIPNNHRRFPKTYAGFTGFIVHKLRNIANRW